MCLIKFGSYWFSTSGNVWPRTGTRGKARCGALLPIPSAVAQRCALVGAQEQEELSCETRWGPQRIPSARLANLAGRARNHLLAADLGAAMADYGALPAAVPGEGAAQPLSAASEHEAEPDANPAPVSRQAVASGKRSHALDSERVADAPAAAGVAEIAGNDGLSIWVDHEETFQTRYVRTRDKNLRCFPTCSETHMPRSFCGVPVAVSARLPPGLSADDTYIVAEFRSIRLQPPRWRAGDTVPDRVAMAIGAEQMEKLYKGELTAVHADVAEFQVRPPGRWRCSSYTCFKPAYYAHVFTVYLVDVARSVCIGVADSPPFAVVPAWIVPEHCPTQRTVKAARHVQSPQEAVESDEDTSTSEEDAAGGIADAPPLSSSGASSASTNTVTGNHGLTSPPPNAHALLLARAQAQAQALPTPEHSPPYLAGFGPPYGALHGAGWSMNASMWTGMPAYVPLPGQQGPFAGLQPAFMPLRGPTGVHHLLPPMAAALTGGLAAEGTRLQLSPEQPQFGSSGGTEDVFTPGHPQPAATRALASVHDHVGCGLGSAFWGLGELYRCP